MSVSTGTCRICESEHVECRHFDIYCFGSEGVWLCHACEMQVVEFIRAMNSVAARATKATHLRMRKVKASQ